MPARDVLDFIDGALVRDRPGMRGAFMSQVGWCASRSLAAVRGRLARAEWELEVARAELEMLRAGQRMVELGGDPYAR